MISVPTEKGKTMALDSGYWEKDVRCENCRFRYAVMKHPTYQETLTHVCLCALVSEGDDYILEVKGHDRCENWTERRTGE